MLVLNYPPLSLIAEKIIYYLITYIFYHFTLSKTHCFASCLHIKWTDHYNVLDESKLLCRHNLEDNSWFLKLSLELLFFRNLSHYTTSCQATFGKKVVSSLFSGFKNTKWRHDMIFLEWIVLLEPHVFDGDSGWYSLPINNKINRMVYS